MEAWVIGAGPAGLMAAEMLAASGLSVTVAEAKPSLARKFLMAGKSGLNLTKDEAPHEFMQAYGAARGPLEPMLSAFGSAETCAWADGLGQRLFTGSTGRVFPKAMKASPLLRAWAARLTAGGVTLRTKWRWTGWNGEATVFDTPDGPELVYPGALVLALGGASWARLGSDGAWAPLLAAQGVPLTPFAPANVGLKLTWSPPMTRHFGSPLKGIALMAGAQRVRGEAVISRRGLEGGGVYQISAAIRDGRPLTLDLVPDVTPTKLLERLRQPQGKASLSSFLRKTVRLAPPKVALLREFARPMPETPDARAQVIKALPVRHAGLRPLDEAISTAGGIRWDGLTEDLMLRARPGVFAAGEMLDWEAPTGGYLLTACFATGRWAGLAAARYVQSGCGV